MKSLRCLLKCIAFICLLWPATLAAQFTDNFSDGDFTGNPAWSGDASKFTISSGLLRLNDLSFTTGIAGVSVSSQAIYNATWEFYFQLDVSPSSTNFSRIYLVSDQSNLSGSLNGYFVMIGNTTKEVSLYKQTGLTKTEIIDGADRATDFASLVKAKIKVTRDGSGNWTLFTDTSPTGPSGSYAQEGTIVDNSFTSSSYFGVQCVYTSTRFDKYWFDDFIITGPSSPDLTPPTVTNTTIVNANSVSITFSESVDATTSQLASNYTVGGNNPQSAILQGDGVTVLLTLSTPLTNGITYPIAVQNVTDLNANVMTPASSNKLYFIAYPVSKKDIIVSEFLPDPSPSVGLPDFEFVEVHNRSANPVNLNGWKLSDGSSTATLPSNILLPGGYVVITSTAGASSFSGALGVANFPSLNNTGDNIILKNDLLVTIDSIHYATAWYHDADKQDGGWSIEIIDPENVCAEESNWTASLNLNGGTPGVVNFVNASNPDITAPIIQSAKIKSVNQILVTFDEKLNGSNSIGASLSPVVSISSVSYSTNLKQITITTSQNLQSSTVYTLTLTNVYDCPGNALINNSTDLVLPEAAQSGDIIINEILFNPRTGGVDFVELYNASNKYISIKKWSLGNVSAGVVSNKKVSTADITLAPDTYRVFTSDSSVLRSQYPNTVKSTVTVMTLPSLPDDTGSVIILDSLNRRLDSLNYDQNWHTVSAVEGVSLERISSTTSAEFSSNWKSAHAVVNFATPGYFNSAGYPFILSVDITSANSIDITFSKKLDATTAQSLANYSITPNSVATATLSVVGQTVTLTLNHALTNGLSYTVSCSGIKDDQGRTMIPDSKDILYFTSSPVSHKDVIISEFIADPTPAIGLPEYEFIEIYNRSANAIDLNNWKLTDGSTTATLPSRILLPDSYLVITSISGASSFTTAIGVSGFPSLTNTGDYIILKSNLLTVDSIHYTTTWYHSEEKQDGGWSLEIVDPENLCEEEGNWTASESLTGGTPGVVNSVNGNNPDLTAPEIELAVIESPNKIIVTFNEKLDGHYLTAALIEPGASSTSVLYANDLRSITINVNDALLVNTVYTLTLANIFDCSGNALIENTVELVLPEAAQPGDILINEVLFNPKSGGVDFVEVYNTSGKHISLKKWALANIEENVTTNLKALSRPVILAPHSFQVFTADPAILVSQYSKTVQSACLTTTLPSLNDDEGSIALVDSLGVVVDFFFYKDDYHVAFLKDDEGVSLERVSLAALTNDPNNWRSASQFENFATPGYKNSASTDGQAAHEGDVIVEPEIFSPQVPPTDFTTINYKFNQSGKVANAQILDQQGRLIKTIANNEVLGSEGFFRWDGDKDDGSRARAGYYVAWLEVFDSGGSVTTFRKRIVVSFR